MFAVSCTAPKQGSEDVTANQKLLSKGDNTFLTATKGTEMVTEGVIRGPELPRAAKQHTQDPEPHR